MSDSVRQSTNKNPTTSTQMYLRIAEIHDDVVVLKSGGIRAVLEVGSVNINLKSEEEQNAIVYSYQGFLNSLEFPIQIIVQSKKMDISGYLVRLQEIAKKQTNDLLKNQVFEYSEYIRRLVEFADIMKKKFYLIIPYDPSYVTRVSIFQKFWDYIHPGDSIGSFHRRRKEFDNIVKNLTRRIDEVSNGLENCGLKSKRLTTPELIKLFYNIYNPLTARNEKIKDPSKLDLVDAAQTRKATE